MKPFQQTEDSPSQQAEAEYPLLDGWSESESSLSQQGYYKEYGRADANSCGGCDQPLSEVMEPFHVSFLSHVMFFVRASIPALCFFAGYVLAAFQFFKPCGL
jgi:hypothetical protein